MFTKKILIKDGSGKFVSQLTLTLVQQRTVYIVRRNIFAFSTSISNVKC